MISKRFYEKFLSAIYFKKNLLSNKLKIEEEEMFLKI